MSNTDMEDQIYSVDVTQKAEDTTWEIAETYLLQKRTGRFLGAIAWQDVLYGPLDQYLREIVKLLDDRLNSTTNPTMLPPGKVVLQPRGSYASRTALRGHVDLDLDLVFPENFPIIFEGDNNKNIERTIGQVLGSQNFENLFGRDPVDGHDGSGNLIVTKKGLWLVLVYVWGKLVSPKKDYVLPKKFTKKPFDIPSNETIPIRTDLIPDMRLVPDMTLATITRSIPAEIVKAVDGKKAPQVPVDFFVKVVTKGLGGEEVLVGVDKDGPLGMRRYQTTTFIPSGKEWHGGKPLSPINRTALLALKWWKNSFPQDKTIKDFMVRDPKGGEPNRKGRKEDIKIKSHHLLSALNALQELPPTDPLYVSNYGSLPFSLLRVMDVMVKVLLYLERAYQPAQRFNIAYTSRWDPSIPKEGRADFPFPQESCGVFEILYKQVANDIVGYDAIINSRVIPTFIGRLRTALEKLAKDSFNTLTPSTYTFEELS